MNTAKHATKPLRVAIYHRVSTLDQDSSLASDELKAAAMFRGMEVVLAVEETGSGAKNSRPGLQKVMEAAKRGEIDVIMVWKLDRFGRSSLDLLSNVNKLESFGVEFIAITQGLHIRPAGDAMSRLLVTMLSAISEFERSLVRERTLLGLSKAKKRGKQLGRRVNRNAPDPTRVLALRESGMSWTQVAKELGCPATSARRALRRLPQTGLVSSVPNLEKEAA